MLLNIDHSLAKIYAWFKIFKSLKELILRGESLIQYYPNDAEQSNRETCPNFLN